MTSAYRDTRLGTALREELQEFIDHNVFEDGSLRNGWKELALQRFDVLCTQVLDTTKTFTVNEKHKRVVDGKITAKIDWYQKIDNVYTFQLRDVHLTGIAYTQTYNQEVEVKVSRLRVKAVRAEDVARELPERLNKIPNAYKTALAEEERYARRPPAAGSSSQMTIPQTDGPGDDDDFDEDFEDEAAPAAAGQQSLRGRMRANPPPPQAQQQPRPPVPIVMAPEPIVMPPAPARSSKAARSSVQVAEASSDEDDEDALQHFVAMANKPKKKRKTKGKQPAADAAAGGRKKQKTSAAAVVAAVRALPSGVLPSGVNMQAIQQLQPVEEDDDDEWEDEDEDGSGDEDQRETTPISPPHDSDDELYLDHAASNEPNQLVAQWVKIVKKGAQVDSFLLSLKSGLGEINGISYAFATCKAEFSYE